MIGPSEHNGLVLRPLYSFGYRHSRCCFDQLNYQACWSYHFRMVQHPGEAPLIGLTAYREPACWGPWDEPADLLPASYARSVVRAGGLPVLLPPAPLSAARGLVARLQGLVITGGADVEPGRYGARPDPNTGPPRPDRDGWELALVQAAMERDLPVLGICRGMQVLNVALGGTLVQHLPDRVGSDAHCPQPGVHGRHPVRISGSGRVQRAMGDAAVVATYHHQAIDRPGAGLEPVGWSEDGTIEAVEHRDCAWLVGVQWHPEVIDGAKLFGQFLQACQVGCHAAGEPVVGSSR
jgi:putative glutamine amidotransferase